MIRHISKMEFDTEFPKEKFISSSTEGINLVLNKYQTLSIDKKKDFLKELQDKITELEKRLAFEYNGKLLEDNSKIFIDEKKNLFVPKIVSITLYDLNSEKAEVIPIEKWLK